MLIDMEIMLEQAINEAAINAKYIQRYESQGRDIDLNYIYTLRYGPYSGAQPPIYKNILNIGLPTFLNKGKLEAIAYGVSEKMMKIWSNRNTPDGYDTIFSKFRHLISDERNLLKMVEDDCGRIDGDTKIYHYNFMKNQKRISVLLCSDYLNIYKGYIMIDNANFSIIDQ